MLQLFNDFPVVMLVISAIAAGLFYFAVDHFKAYVMDGSRDPVRITSLRYLQIFVFLFTFALIGIVVALYSLLGAVTANRSTNRDPGALTAIPGEMLETTLPGEGGLESATMTPAATPTLTPAPPTPTPNVTAVIGNTGGAGANLRSIPGTEGAIITSVNEGIEVTVLDETETMDGFTWQRVVLPDGRQGWIVTNYLIYNP
jgi:hypothetical protein